MSASRQRVILRVSGLLEIQTSFGSYGSVCGMNAEAASVACRQLGFEFGVQSPSPCGQYGGGELVWGSRITCCREELEVPGDRNEC